MMGNMGDGMGLGMGLWMALWGLIALALLVVLILAIVWLIRALFRPAAHSGQRRGEADDVLRRRYAAGEIDEEEYQRRRDALRGH
ncbi:MAG: SHOCT domain-containing protein [Pseudonocardiaceae bacterium]